MREDRQTGWETQTRADRTVALSARDVLGRPIGHTGRPSEGHAQEERRSHALQARVSFIWNGRTRSQSRGACMRRTSWSLDRVLPFLPFLRSFLCLIRHPHPYILVSPSFFCLFSSLPCILPLSPFLIPTRLPIPTFYSLVLLY